MSDNREAVAHALTALGTAYRMDWSDFDGRTLRDELGNLAEALAHDAPPFDAPRWLAFCASVCPVEHCEIGACTTRRNHSECEHTVALYQPTGGEA